MSDHRILVDTNILIYSVDRRDQEKQRTAITVLHRLASDGTGVISTQTLSEYFSALTSKVVLAEQISLTDAADQIADYARSWSVVDITPAIVLEAIDGVRRYQLSYWDAQIWAAARLNQINTIYSEDGPTDSVLGNVKFINPLQS